MESIATFDDKQFKRLDAALYRWQGLFPKPQTEDALPDLNDHAARTENQPPNQSADNGRGTGAGTVVTERG